MANQIIDKALAYIGDEFPTVKTNTESMMADAYPFRPQILGSASSSGVTFYLETGRTYIIITGHNSTAEANGLWIARLGGQSVFSLCGGSAVTVTAGNSTVRVVTNGVTVNVYAIRLPS